MKGKSKNCLIPVFILVIILFSGSAFANFEPVYKPTVQIDRTAESIKIDGSLNDPAWKKANKVDNFVERHPGDNLPPLVSTKALLTYDNKNLYIAFVCHDDPNSIRATMCQRDQFSYDDAVVVMLDAFGDANWAYEFYVNPYGIQKDILWTNVSGEDTGYDLIWESAAKITDSGYQVEIAIPFSSIKFPNSEQQNWKMDFWRMHPRDSYRKYSWSANNRNEQCWPCQWGNVNGINNIKPGRGLEILPSFISNQASELNFSNPADPGVPFDEHKINGELSLGGKYSINSNVTIEAAYNPDFSQIETDATQIDVNSTVALFYSERRPFFQEGRDIFGTIFNSFYTRTINDPQFAMKVIGRTDLYRFGIVSAVDENSVYIIPGENETLDMLNVGKSYVNVFRAMRSFGSSTQLGFMLNDRRFEVGGYNTVAAFDQRIRLSQNYWIDGQYIATFTEEPNKPELTANNWRHGDLRDYQFNNNEYNAGFDGEKYAGYGLISRFHRNGRHWNMLLDYNQVDHSYRSETGFDPWVNYRNLSMWNGYNIYFENNPVFTKISPQIWIGNRWTYEGTSKWTQLNVSLDNNLSFAQTYIGLNYNNGNELWYGDRFNDLWGVSANLNSRPFSWLGLSISAKYGANVYINTNPARKGRETEFYASLILKPIDRLTIAPNFNFQKMTAYNTGEEFYSGFITRTRLRFQATKAISLRLVVEHDNFDHVWNIDPLLTYRLSPFTVFYIGSSQQYTNYGDADYDYKFRQYNETTELYDPIHKDFKRNWSLNNRQFFMKLQYLFQT